MRYLVQVSVYFETAKKKRQKNKYFLPQNIKKED